MNEMIRNLNREIKFYFKNGNFKTEKYLKLKIQWMSKIEIKGKKSMSLNLSIRIIQSEKQKKDSTKR